MGWFALFHYEALRPLYLTHWLKRDLPKTPLFFPSNGWTMYYSIGNFWMTAEVYGQKEEGGKPERIPAEKIFKLAFLKADFFRRNTIGKILEPEAQKSFCEYLKRQLPEYQSFAVMKSGYTQLVPERSEKQYFPPSFICSR
ncbi:MAG: hypothetical protein HYZ85_01685 [Candidatus Omnitrophica bacterium]|nr:hypothetical protein [Candidatus Omnitrophota bacterium]